MRTAIITFCLAAIVACGSYKQLRALPARWQPVDTLEAISRKMYTEGNVNCLLVLAIRDSFIHFNRHYNFTYNEGKISVDNKQLPEPYQSRYVSLFKSLPSGSSITMWSTRGDSIKVKEVFDPSSDFRNYKAFDNKHVQTVYTSPIKTEVPAAAPVQHYNSDIIVKELLADKLVDTLQPIFLRYGDGVLFVNEKKVTGSLKEKYYQLLAEYEGYVPSNVGLTTTQIYPQGVMAPSSTNGNSKIQFPRQEGQRPYVFAVPGGTKETRETAYEMLKRELMADQLADTNYTVHLEYNIKGIFINSKKLEQTNFLKYQKVLVEQFNAPIPKQESDLVDMTF